MEKLLKELNLKKLKLEIKRKRFQLWQEEIDRKGLMTEKDSNRSYDFFIKERRLDSRIEELQEKINYINNKKLAKSWSRKIRNMLNAVKPVNIGGTNV